MNPTVAASIAQQLAELVPTSEPTLDEALGYGRDLSCTSDLADDFREVRGETPEIIMQALQRRFTTPRGTLADDEDYGLDLTTRVHRPLTPNELRSLQSQCIGEARKDERIDTITMRLTYENKTLSVSGTLTPRNPKLNPFTYVLRATSADVVLEALNGKKVA